MKNYVIDWRNACHICNTGSHTCSDATTLMWAGFSSVGSFGHSPTEMINFQGFIMCIWSFQFPPSMSLQSFPTFLSLTTVCLASAGTFELSWLSKLVDIWPNFTWHYLLFSFIVTFGQAAYTQIWTIDFCMRLMLNANAVVNQNPFTANTNVKLSLNHRKQLMVWFFFFVNTHKWTHNYFYWTLKGKQDRQLTWVNI